MVSGIESVAQAVDKALTIYIPAGAPAKMVKLVVDVVVVVVTIPAATNPAGKRHVVGLFNALGVTDNV